MNISGSINGLNGFFILPSSSSSSSNFQRQQQQNNPSVITINSANPVERCQKGKEQPSPPKVKVPAGSFAFVKEKVNNREVEKLYVKEKNIKNGFIRKYLKQSGKWKCCRCVSNKNIRKRSNSGTVHDYYYGRIKEAEYNENEKTCEVAKAHSTNICEPYPITPEEFQRHFPLYKRKPKISKKVVTTATSNSPITMQIPNLSSPPRNIVPSSLSIDSEYAAADTNRIPSPVPCSSRTLLYSTNPANNPMRSGSTRLPPRSPRRVEILRHTVIQQSQQPPAPAVFSSCQQRVETATVRHQQTPANIAHAVTSQPSQILSSTIFSSSPRRVESLGHTVTQQSQHTPAQTFSSSSQQRVELATATVHQQPTPANDGNTVTLQPQHTPAPTVSSPPPPYAEAVVDTVLEHPQSIPAEAIVQRSDDDPPVITEGAGNYHEEENVQKNSREKSMTIPDDPIAHELIPVKGEALIPIEFEYPLRNNANEEEMEVVEQKYEIVSFPRFSEKALIAACKNLGLDSYSKKQALTFWANIEVEIVKSRSDTIISGEKMNGFQCFSFFLTGSGENQFELCINLKDKLENNEQLKARYDVAQRRVMSKKFCEEHLNLIANWISCRIGIYEHGTLKKYGDWSRSRPSNELIILIEKDGDKYAPIFNL